MRTSILLSAACAAVVLANPVPDEVIVTTVDISYVTDIVYVTAGVSAAVAVASSAASTTSARIAGHRHRKSHTKSATTAAAASVTSAVALPDTTSTDVASTTTDAPVVYSTLESTDTLTAASSAAATSVAETTVVATSAAATSAAATSAAAASTTQPAAAGATATTYQQAVVDAHNVARTVHDSPAIAWDDTMYQAALTIASTCIYGHVMDIISTPYGQNIAAGPGPDSISNIIVDMFYVPECAAFTAGNLYGQANPDMSNFENWGHFSQVVWKGSVGVGCATVNCGSSLQQRDSTTQALSALNLGGTNSFTVCNYALPGNYGGEYADNIAAPVTALTYTGSSSIFDKAAILADWQTTPAKAASKA